MRVANPLVSTDWLSGNLSAPDLRVLDVTVHLDPTPAGRFEPRSGYEDFQAGHIPGAQFLDVLADLSEPQAELAFTRPAADDVAAVVSRLGVSRDHHVALYSAGEMMWATRAWWVLRWVGLANLSVLDGGFAKWQAEGRPISSEAPTFPAAAFRAQEAEAAWASQDEVLQAIEDGGVCTLNALPEPIHRGEADLGYRRRGHIAGSGNVSFTETLDAAAGTFRPPAELRAVFEATDALQRNRVICYCGGGIAATQNAFALLLAGHPNVAVYDGGLDEWSRDLRLPMEGPSAGRGPA